jgi:hypothetical protein
VQNYFMIHFLKQNKTADHKTLDTKLRACNFDSR